jgi:hypothetical protein
MDPLAPCISPDRFSGLLARRAVLLGASNLTRSIGTIVDIACRLWKGPLDILAAFGHGRSYGLRKGVIGRTLPGISECGLWRALEQQSPAATAALLTDIGNDLLYDVCVPQILDWVEKCVERLQRVGARVVLTPLPVCSVAALSPARFLFLRSLLFPGCRLSYALLLERAGELDRRLRALAGERGLLLAEHQRQWYGFDPIHIRRRHVATAWEEILSRWLDAPPPRAGVQAPWRRRLYVRLLTPEQRWVFGWERRRTQPAGVLEEGTTLAFY